MSCVEALQSPKPVQDKNLKIILVSAAALINQDGRVLIAQRPENKDMAGLWEFPGGKVKDGETPEFALMRELEEELGIQTRPTCFSPIGFTSHSYEDFHLLMPLFACRMWKGEPKLLEHQAFEWVRPVDLHGYNMPPADIPLIAQLRDHL